MDYYFKASNRTGGTGTELNPWLLPLASSASIINDKLRAKYLAAETNARFFFAAGNYECWGQGDIVSYVTDGTHGFAALEGWQFIGPGMGAATLKLVPKGGIDYDGQTVNLITSQDASDNLAVRDLTLNVNWAGFIGETDCAGTVGIGGRMSSGLRIERVEIIGHGAAEMDRGAAILGWAISQRATGVVVRDCWLHSPAATGGDWAHGIALACNNNHTALPGDATITAHVLNNRVEGLAGANFSIGIGVQGEECIIADNYITGHSHGLYCDTGYNKRMTWERNLIEGVTYGIVFISGWYDGTGSQPHTYRNIFRNNVVEVSATGVGFHAMKVTTLRAMSHTVANPTVITLAAPHGMTTGDSVTITYAAGTTGSTPTIEGTYTATVTGPRTISIPVNVTVAATNANPDTGLASVVIPGTRGYTGFKENLVEGNIIRYTSGSTGDRAGLVIDAGTEATGNVVRDNTVASELLTSVP